MTLRRRDLLQLAAGGAAFAAVPRQARGQSWPARSITFIVPFPPGGSTDPVGRIVAARMADALGQAMVVENIGGAGGSIGVGRLARATADGYTIDIGQWDTHVLNGAARNLAYDLQKDFAPIGLVSHNPMLLVTRRSFPANDLTSAVAWMKVHPGQAKFGNLSGSSQVVKFSLERLAGTEMLFIPYRGGGPALTDLLSGQVDFLALQASGAMPHLRAGTLKALANLSPQRSAAIPGIPTSDESGLPGLYMSGWFGLFAPKGTPADVIAKLSAAMRQALADPPVRQKLTDLGLDIAPREQQTPEGLAAFHKAEVEKWWPIIKAAGIRLE